MSRKRLLSPEFFTHAELYDAEAKSGLPLRLAFAGLWTATDRRGLFRWRPRELKLAILPYDPADFAAVLEALEGAGFIRRYVVEGKEYGHIPGFTKWQTFHPHEKPSDVPSPPGVRSEPTIGGLEPDNDGPKQPVVITVPIAIASTGTVTNAVPTKTRRTRAAKAAATPMPAWVDALRGRWMRRAGAVTPREVHSTLADLIALHGEPAVLRAIDLYADEKAASGKPPKLAWFASEASTWVERSGPIVDPVSGTLNARGIALLAGTP